MEKNLPTIEGYRLLAVLGEGESGTVYLAETESTPPRRIALRALKKGQVREEEIGRILGALRHPNLLPIFAISERDGTSFIEMEHVEGATLREHLDRREARPVFGGRFAPTGSFGLREDILAMARIVDAVEQMHQGGVVHGVIDPGNILVRADGHPFLTGIGWKQISEEGYRAPEQVREPTGVVDSRTDVHALGVILYELVTAGKPDATPLRYRPLERSRLTRRLEPVIRRALEKESEHRYGSAAALALDLKRAAAGALPRVAALGPGMRRYSRRLRFRRATLGGGVVAVLVGLLAFFNSLSQSASPERSEALVLAAQYAIESGDIEQAAKLVRKLEPDSPEAPIGYLTLAMGYAQAGRFDEAQEQIDRARKPELDSPPGESEDLATRHLKEGMRRLAGREPPDYPACEESFLDAIELDPDLNPAYYPLHRVRRSMGDLEGAAAALARYKKGLDADVDYYPMVHALQFEWHGRYEDACEVLEKFADRVSRRRAQQLRLHQTLGRNYLLRGHLEDAERHLRIAVAQIEHDDAAWVSLANVYWHRSTRAFEDDPESNLAWSHLKHAEKLANEAKSINPAQVEAQRTLAFIALSPMMPASDRDWEGIATERIAELRRMRPEDPWLSMLEGRLLFLRGRLEEDVLDLSSAEERYRECLSFDPEHLAARALLARAIWIQADAIPFGITAQERFAEALEQLLEARRIWNETKMRGRSISLTAQLAAGWEKRWLARILVWTFGTASRLDDVDTALRARQAMEKELRSGVNIPAEDLLRFADFLATATDDRLRDCTLARILVEDHALEDRLANDDSSRRILDRIEEACR